MPILFDSVGVILWSNTVSMSANLLISFELSKQSRANVSYFAHILREIVEKRFVGRFIARSFFVGERDVYASS